MFFIILDFWGIKMPNIPVARPGRKRQYLSIHKHQASNTNKKWSKWVNINVEKDTFDAADYGNFNKMPGNDSWEDDVMNLWGVLPGFDYVGTKKQQFGFFPKTQNPTDAWHGYPVNHDYRNMKKSLVEFFVEKGIIDSDDVPALLKGKKLAR